MTRRTLTDARREGMADACVLILAAKAVPPTRRLADLAKACGLTDVELQDAVARFKQRANGTPRRAEQRTQPPATKLCRRCGREKPASQFHGNVSNRDRLQAWCKPCLLAYQRNRRTAARQRGST